MHELVDGRGDGEGGEDVEDDLTGGKFAPVEDREREKKQQNQEDPRLGISPIHEAQVARVAWFDR